MNDTHDCKGCLGIDHDCYYDSYIEELKCPCTICLIKVVCNEACNSFDEFTEQYRQHRAEIRDCPQ